MISLSSPLLRVSRDELADVELFAAVNSSRPAALNTPLVAAYESSSSIACDVFFNYRYIEYNSNLLQKLFLTIDLRIV